MKILLSKVLYYIGHFVSLFMKGEWLGTLLHPLYSKIMTWSFYLDKEGKIWKIVKKRKLHE